MKSNIYIEFYAFLFLFYFHYWKVIWVTQIGCSMKELWCIAPGIRNARFKIINGSIIYNNSHEAAVRIENRNNKSADNNVRCLEESDYDISHNMWALIIFLSVI